MSINIAIEQLRAETFKFKRKPYLLTQDDDGRPRAVAVSFEWRDETIYLKTGKRSQANIVARGLVSLLWPPDEAEGYSLIVDGDGSLPGGSDADQVVICPTRGVLHRPGVSSIQQPNGCASDCLPLPKGGH